MQRTGLAVLLALAPLAVCGEPVNPLCAPLQAFVASLRPDESKAFTFHTICGANFKDAPEPALRAKRCLHHGDDTAKAFCAHLMAHGATEFAGANVARAVECLAPGTRFAKGVDMRQADFSLTYGSEERGSTVKIVFKEELQLGGMALHIVAQGY